MCSVTFARGGRGFESRRAKARSSVGEHQHRALEHACGVSSIEVATTGSRRRCRK
jgi:hypothetical protein